MRTPALPGDIGREDGAIVNNVLFSLDIRRWCSWLHDAAVESAPYITAFNRVAYDHVHPALPNLPALLREEAAR